MTYIFDNYSVDNAYRLALNNFSPYAECLNTQGLEREVNGLFRFSDIFKELAGYLEGGKDRSEEISLLFHILANYDLLSGMTGMDIHMILWEEMIQGGYCGDRNKDLYEKLSNHQKYIILKYFEHRRQSNIRRSYAYEAGRELLDAMFYYSCAKECLLIFIPFAKKEKSAEDSECTYGELYELWRSMFLDYWVKDKAVWEKHFGVIGFESLMTIGELQLI